MRHMARQIHILDCGSDLSLDTEDKQIGGRMIIGVLILWILIKLQAPTWCYILIGGHFLIYLAEWILDILVKRLESLNKELERKQKLEELGGR